MSYIISSVTILPMLNDIDLDKIVAMVDIDDVCWPFIPCALSRAGVDPSKMHTFAVKENQLYTAEEKARIFQAFRDPETFKNIQFHAAVTKLQQLIAIGIKVQLNSKSFFDEISDLKRTQLKKAVPALRDEDFILTTSSGDHATDGKKVGENITFFIDDNPYNVLTSGARYNLLPSQTWNTSAEEQYRIRSKNFYLFSDLDVILETIHKSVCFWREHYS